MLARGEWSGKRKERKWKSYVCVVVSCFFSFLKRRKLCNKISPSQGHQFYVSDTWINQMNVYVCVSVCQRKSVCVFRVFLFVYWYLPSECGEWKKGQFLTQHKCIFIYVWKHHHHCVVFHLARDATKTKSLMFFVSRFIFIICFSFYLSVRILK